MIGPTARQNECLDFIRAHVREKGFPPAFREIKDALGVTSNATISHLLKCLVERGHIKITPRLSRSIKLIEPKYNHAADCLCAACPARRLQYQQMIQGLQTETKVSPSIRLRDLRVPTLQERADLLGIQLFAAPRTRTALPREAG